MEKRPRDKVKIYVPSKLYLFFPLRESVDTSFELGTELPECAIIIFMSRTEVTESLLTLCRRISTNQEVKCFWMCGVDFTYSKMLTMSNDTRSVNMRFCQLPDEFTRNILDQLFCCIQSLEYLKLSGMDLSPFEDELDKLFQDLASHHQTGSAQRKLRLNLGEKFRGEPILLSTGFVRKWERRFLTINNIQCKICCVRSEGGDIRDIFCYLLCRCCLTCKLPCQSDESDVADED